MIGCVLEMKVDIVHFDLQALHTHPSMLHVYSRMPQVANQSYAKAAQLRLSGAGWDGALKEAAIPDTELARSSVRRTIRKLKAETKAKVEAKAEAAKAKAEAVSPWALFRARRRRWARAAGHGAAREPVGAAGWGRRRPDAPLWCGCCSSPTPVLGAAGTGST